MDDAKSPPTPTQDEQFVYGVAEGEVVMTNDETTESNIPVYEVSMATPTGNMTRSRAKRRNSDDRPGTPYR